MNQTIGSLNTIADARQRLGGIGVTTIYYWIKAAGRRKEAA